MKRANQGSLAAVRSRRSLRPDESAASTFPSAPHRKRSSAALQLSSSVGRTKPTRSCSNRVRIFIENGGANFQQMSDGRHRHGCLQHAKTITIKQPVTHPALPWRRQRSQPNRTRHRRFPIPRTQGASPKTHRPLNRSNARSPSRPVANHQRLAPQTNHLAATARSSPPRSPSPRHHKTPAPPSAFAASIRPHRTPAATPPDSHPTKRRTQPKKRR